MGKGSQFKSSCVSKESDEYHCGATKWEGIRNTADLWQYEDNWINLEYSILERWILLEDI